MKILYISQPNFADCDFPLIRAFQQKGVDVTYLIPLTPFHLRASLIDIKKQLPQTGIFHATVYTEFHYLKDYMDMSKVYVANRPGKTRLTFSYWKSVWNLRRFIKKGKYDVIHYTTYRNGWFYNLAPLITTIHDPFPHTGEATKKSAKKRAVAVKRSKGIVLLNEVQLNEFCNAYSIDPQRVLVNSLGVYDNICSFINPQIKPIKNNVLFFGRIHPYKGIEYLCEAMTIVHDQIPDATLTIAGRGNMYFDFEPYKKLNYIKVINNFISMPDLADLLSSCEISVCPYTDATQSGVIMTCFALGKPVVASAVGGLVEMIEEGKSGLLVPPKDAEALASAIVSLLKDDKRKQNMSDYIIDEYFKGKRSWSAIANRYLKYYTRILNE